LLAVSHGNIPRLNAGAAVLLDSRVLAFTLGITLITGILFGLAPALHLSRAGLMTPIRNRRLRARGAMVIAEVAVALVLLVGAELFLRTFDALRRVPAGFDGRNVLTMETALAGNRFDTAASVNVMVREAEDRIRAIPGVVSVAVAPSVPLESSIGMTFNIDGRPPGAQLYHGGASWRTVTPGYFDVFRIPILRGRGFTERDNSATGPVAVISQSMALSQWPHDNPIGRTISIYGGGDDVNTLRCQVVGIAGDVHQDGLHEEAGSVIYYPLAQLSDAQMVLQRKIVPLSWEVRTHGAPLKLAAAVQHEIEREGLPAAHVRAMEQVFSASLARDRFNTLLMTIFAVTAILLAGIGLYGVLSFTVQQRTQEFGIRLALGADSAQLRNVVIGQAMTLAGIGIGIGLAAAWLLTRLMAAVLFGVQPRDPVVFATVPVLLAAVALGASALPARRAVRLEPMEALRRE
jgi:putative ABC transport system permease protein